MFYYCSPTIYETMTYIIYPEIIKDTDISVILADPISVILSEVYDIVEYMYKNKHDYMPNANNKTFIKMHLSARKYVKEMINPLSQK